MNATDKAHVLAPAEGSERTQSNIRIMILEGNRLFRESLACLLAQQERIEVLESGQMADAFARIQSTLPDIVLIGFGAAEEAAAIRLIMRIRSDLFSVKVIILGFAEPVSTIQEWAAAGASGYTLEGASIEDLLSTIHLVHRGKAMCSPRIAQGNPTGFPRLHPAEKERQLHSTIQLSLRELEILRLISRGMSNKQIASKLCISLHTVKNHVHNILEKLSARNRSEAVHRAVRNGWLKIAVNID